VENLGFKENFRSFKGVILAKVDVNHKFSSLIRSLLRANNSCVPISHAVTNKGNANTLNDLVNIEIVQFLFKI
jgi:hypothetical protein